MKVYTLLNDEMCLGVTASKDKAKSWESDAFFSDLADNNNSYSEHILEDFPLDTIHDYSAEGLSNAWKEHVTEIKEGCYPDFFKGFEKGMEFVINKLKDGSKEG